MRMKKLTALGSDGRLHVVIETSEATVVETPHGVSIAPGIPSYVLEATEDLLIWDSTTGHLRNMDMSKTFRVHPAGQN